MSLLTGLAPPATEFSPPTQLGLSRESWGAFYGSGNFIVAVFCFQCTWNVCLSCCFLLRAWLELREVFLNHAPDGYVCTAIAGIHKSKKCTVCVAGKLCILEARKSSILNNRLKLVSKCRHENMCDGFVIFVNKTRHGI